MIDRGRSHHIGTVKAEGISPARRHSILLWSDKGAIKYLEKHCKLKESCGVSKEFLRLVIKSFVFYLLHAYISIPPHLLKKLTYLRSFFFRILWQHIKIISLDRRFQVIADLNTYLHCRSVLASATHLYAQCP